MEGGSFTSLSRLCPRACVQEVRALFILKPAVNSLHLLIAPPSAFRMCAGVFFVIKLFRVGDDKEAAIIEAFKA